LGKGRRLVYQVVLQTSASSRKPIGMYSFGILFALAQALGFKAQELTERRLQEHGVSAFRAFALQRYALIPALIWTAVFVRKDDVYLVIHSPILIGYLLFIAIAWNLQSFISSYLLNRISSMTGFSTLQHMVYLPILLIIGTFFNHDTPNMYSLLAVLSLVAAFAIQPAPHEENTRPRFALPVAAIVGIALLGTLINGANSGISRNALQMLRPEDFLAFFSVITIALCWAWTLFFPGTPEEARILKKYRWQAMAVPLIWFAASIPESWAYAELPIYIVVSIGAITFAFDTISDFTHRRIRFNLRTASFILLALLGMGLAVYAA